MPTVSYIRQTVRSQFQANSHTSGDQLTPDVLGLSNGGYVVAYGNDGVTVDWILLNFYDATGANLGGFKIPYTGNDTNSIGAPSLTELSNGNVLVSWADTDATHPGIRATIFSPTGTVVTPNFAITTFATDRIPQVTALEGGGFVATYQVSTTVVARIYNSAGTPLGAEFTVPTSAATESDPTITGLADGGFVISWTNDNAGTIEIWARIFDANGSARTVNGSTNGFLVGASGVNTQPAAAALPNGNWAVAYRDSGWGDEDTGITLTIMSPTGTFIRTFSHVNSPTDPQNESDPAIAVLENGFIVVTWTYPFNSGVDEDIYARVFDPSGNAVTVNGTSAPFIVTGSATNDIFSAISAIVSGQYIVGWQDSELDDSGSRITATVQQIVRQTFGDGSSESLVGDALRDLIDGAAGNDTLTGGLGIDDLAGGSGFDIFEDTAAGLNGDTIIDFSLGDRIHITDANPTTFSFSLVGNTLNYSGGSLTLSGTITGTIVARPDAGGGVRLVFNDAAHDFNGDGRGDILWRNTDGTIGDWLANTNGSHAINEASLVNVPNHWQAVGTGDFNGDGRDDILWRGNGGEIGNWLASPSGTFAFNPAAGIGVVPTNWVVAGTGDFNGDLRDDILWRNTEGTVANWLANADGSFAIHDASMVHVPNNWQIAGVGDFNGDGRDDILWRGNGGEVGNWLAAADGTFAFNPAAGIGAVPTNWQVIGTGDFNGDGRDDILWRSTDGTIGNWLANADGSFAINEASLVNVPNHWNVASIGDFNGDGREDISWRGNGGELGNWLASPTGVFAFNAAAGITNVPTSWQVEPEDLL